jgi:hypothetical protein
MDKRHAFSSTGAGCEVLLACHRRFSVVLLGAGLLFGVPALLFGNDLRRIQIPLTFERNMGQADASASFVAPLGRGNVLLMREGFALHSPSDRGKAVRVHLLNANPSGPTPGLRIRLRNPRNAIQPGYTPGIELVRV